VEDNLRVRFPTLNPARRRARRGEEFIRSCEFPQHLQLKLKRAAAEVEWEPVERGLREWLVCCAYRRRHPLAMPSRIVDDAWHEFILDTSAYRDFCEQAFGRFLDHFPEDPAFVSDEQRLSSFETIRAWDRSRWSRDGEPTLWTLDQTLGVTDAWGISTRDLHEARARPAGPGWEKESYISGASGGCGGGAA
jgi:hypothetical protein